MGYAEQLDETLRAIEAAVGTVDGGEHAAAEALGTIFQATPSLLTLLGATYVKLASTVAKPPYPPGKYAPLTDVLIDIGGNAVGATTGQAAGFPAPTFRPRLGPMKGVRTVQAPDWWKAEPIFVVDHSKVTRRDVVQAASGSMGAGTSHLADLLLKAQWTGLSVSAFADYTRYVPVREAAGAAVRQIAHEVLHSPELLKLAGRTGKSSSA